VPKKNKNSWFRGCHITTFLPAAFSVLLAFWELPARGGADHHHQRVQRSASSLQKAEVDALQRLLAAGVRERQYGRSFSARKMLWRAKISVAFMRANAQMLLSRQS
jgi:hypothetical protein